MNVGPGERALRQKEQKEFRALGLTDKQVFLAQMECTIAISPFRDKGQVFVWFSVHLILFLCSCCSVPELAIRLFPHLVSDHFQNSKQL